MVLDKGGARIHGFTDAAGGDAALEFQGIINSDADQGYCPIEFRGSDNGTGVQNIAADRRIVNIKNSDGTRIASFTGTGLTFGNDNAAANALNDYEEGTFTPSWNYGYWHKLFFSHLFKSIRKLHKNWQPSVRQFETN